MKEKSSLLDRKEIKMFAKEIIGNEVKPFENKVFRYLYNRDNQQNVSNYKGFAA